MMFVTNQKRVGEWKENGKTWLKEANGQIRKFASQLTPEQFGVVTYITALFSKWCPYDDLNWIIEY